MPTIKTLKALLISSLLASTALGATASAAQVHFVNNVGSNQVVDIYVDGTLVSEDVSTGSFPMFPKEIASGQHTVVVTPADLVPGQQDVFASTINVAGYGVHTLTLNGVRKVSGVRELSLDMTPGLGPDRPAAEK